MALVLTGTALEIEEAVYDVDPETGEILGLASRPEFHVEDQGSAEWLLGRLAIEDSEIVALESRLAALRANLESMIAGRKRTREFLLTRYGAELERFAGSRLPRGKRTWSCPYGSVAFRKLPRSLKVVNEAAAIAFCKEDAPEAVRVTERFLIGSLPKGLKEELLNDPSTAGEAGMEIVPERETATISTGVE